MSIRTMTPSEYKKRKFPDRDETQMLLAVNSRYEDMNGKRVHIMPELEEPILLMSRKKPAGLHVPSVDDITLDLLEAYGCQTKLPLWVRAPFILPNSWAPWSLEPERSYVLATGLWSTPYPKGTSKQKHWDWCLENLSDGAGKFIPHALPEAAKDTTPADHREVHVRLWDDARGPGHPARQAEIQAIVLRATLTGEGTSAYAPILPTDQNSLLTTPNNTITDDYEGVWLGAEEALWASVLDDPDLHLFGLDTEQSKEWETTRNLFLEADNLVALKRLRKGYDAKVKLTYIDPPYNTGGKFVYNDNFKARPNEGSPFLGQRWGRGTWLHCMMAPWVNTEQLGVRDLIPVTDPEMMYPRGPEPEATA